MSAILRARGGWWHDYVCPTHGVELDPAVGDTYPCRYGCRLSGEPYAGAWVVMEHQARAREARLLARRPGTENRHADRDRAVTILTEFASYYAEVAAGGNSERAEAWMLPGKLFSQALTEAIWAVQIADAVVALSASPDAHAELGDDVGRMLESLVETIAHAWEQIVVIRAEPANNYVAWLDAAGGALCRALHALGRTSDDPDLDPALWHSRTLEHLNLATDADGWEWEGATYYHLFVLRAYLLSLQGIEPASLPRDALDRLGSMVRVLAQIAAPDGMLPMLHDGPFDRIGVHQEVLEICVLSRQLWTTTCLDRVEHWVRRRLGPGHDGLEDSLGGWFCGPPASTLACERTSVLFTGTGYAVLRDPADTLTAILDAGPHGGSHGHLDKLGLYLYGHDVGWQPAPGVPPYASALRHGYYSLTRAHPTVRVDGAEQEPTTGTIETWEPRNYPTPPSPHRPPRDLRTDPGAPDDRVVASSDDAITGVRLVRQLVMAPEYLLDVVSARTADGTAREISLALRPAVPFEVTATDGGWRTRWAGPPGRQLHGVHRASVPAALSSAPGRGPSVDPATPIAVGDWSAHASDATFVSVYTLSPTVADLELTHRDGAVASVRITLTNGTTIEHEVAR